MPKCLWCLAPVSEQMRLCLECQAWLDERTRECVEEDPRFFCEDNMVQTTGIDTTFLETPTNGAPQEPISPPKMPTCDLNRDQRFARIKEILVELGPQVTPGQAMERCAAEGIKPSASAFGRACLAVFGVRRPKCAGNRSCRPQPEPTSNGQMKTAAPDVAVKATAKTPTLPVPAPSPASDPVAQLAQVQAVVIALGGIGRARHLLDCLEMLQKGAVLS